MIKKFLYRKFYGDFLIKSFFSEIDFLILLLVFSINNTISDQKSVLNNF